MPQLGECCNLSNLLFQYREYSRSEEFDQITCEIAVGCSSLRRLNRQLKLKQKVVKDELLEQKQAVDADHLTLQNLLYEALHLNKQMSAVKDYK